MSLPTYDKNKRKQRLEMLPKGAYVLKIMNAREDANKSGDGSHLTIAFDIAEGDYKDIYKRRFDADTKEDKKWSNDGMYYLTIPSSGCQQFVEDNWNTFFADLEDSNNGYVFDGDVKNLKGKLIGGKFCIEQNEYNGKIYDHTRLRWTCIADDVRNGKAGRLPNDKLITPQSGLPDDGFIGIDDSIEDDGIPF